MDSKLNIPLMTDDILLKLLSCEICGEICKRGITVPCCSAQACGGCAILKVTKTKECWNCKENVTTQDFVKDQDLRDGVDEMNKTKTCGMKTKLRLKGRPNACRLANDYSGVRNRDIGLVSLEDIIITKETKKENLSRSTTSFSYKTDRSCKKSGLRPIVIDGCNVAFAHGNNKNLSVKGIELVVEFFLSRGHETVVAFLPEDRKEEVYDPVECFALNSLMNKGQLKCPPSKAYDDRMILDYATDHDAVVVSRDKFRDIYQDTPRYRDMIENATLVPTFIGDSVYFPEDPQGRGGKSLDELLRF